MKFQNKNCNINIDHSFNVIAFKQLCFFINKIQTISENALHNSFLKTENWACTCA